MPFKRRIRADNAGNGSSLPAGLRLSRSGLPQTSTGHEDLDAALNGGLLLGSLTIVKQDRITSYYKSFPFAYFIAQGVAHGHATAIVTPTMSPLDVFYNLPTPVSRSTTPIEDEITLQKNSETPRIAWRYYKTKTPSITSSKVSTSANDSYVNRFDLSKPISTFPPPTLPLSLLGPHDDLSPASLLHSLAQHAQQAKSNNLVCRITILDLDLLDFSSFSGGYLSFIFNLKKLAEQCAAVVMIGARDIQGAIGLFADVALSLESFEGKGTDVAGLQKGLMVVGTEWRPPKGKMKGGGMGVWVAKRGRRKWVLEVAAGKVEIDERKEEKKKGMGEGTKELEF